MSLKIEALIAPPRISGYEPSFFART